MPQQIGRYIIQTELGRGGMATVYRAYDPRFKRDVAVKVLTPIFAHDPTFRNKFEKEAQTVAALEHPAIVPVYDFGEANGQLFLVMRLMTGGSLEDRLRRGPLSLELVDFINRRICSALDKAHQHHVVHRDIKPANILFDNDNMPYLVDFGIARLALGTQTTTIIGTPQYMAPEQAQGKPLDGRTDVYQMGVVVFEMLTARTPFAGDNSSAILYQHVHEPLPPIRQLNPAVPAHVETVLTRALAKQRDARYATAGAFASAFSQAVRGIAPTDERKKAIPVWMWAVGGLFLLLLLFGAGTLLGGAGEGGAATDDLRSATVTAIADNEAVFPDGEPVTIANDTDGNVEPTSTVPGAENSAETRQNNTASEELVDEQQQSGNGASNARVAQQSTETLTPVLPTATPIPPTATTVPPTSTPIPPTSTPLPPTPTPQPTPCGIPVASVLAGIYPNHVSALGCPTSGNNNVWMAEEDFERGKMFWREDTDRHYVLYNNGNWASYADTWVDGLPSFACGTPSSPPTPQRGFGLLWCNNQGVRDGLGNATTGEFGDTGTVQQYANGFIIRTGGGSIYVFYGNGVWSR